MSENLRECPFCGSGNVAVLDAIGDVACNDCGTMGPDGRHRNESVARWNSRHASDRRRQSAIELAAEATADAESTAELLNQAVNRGLKAEAAAEKRLEAIRAVQAERDIWRQIAQLLQQSVHGLIEDRELLLKRLRLRSVKLANTEEAVAVRAEAYDDLMDEFEEALADRDDARVGWWIAMGGMWFYGLMLWVVIWLT